jgi:hypothetical protein
MDHRDRAAHDLWVEPGGSWLQVVTEFLQRSRGAVGYGLHPAVDVAGERRALSMHHPQPAGIGADLAEERSRRWWCGVRIARCGSRNYIEQ